MSDDFHKQITLPDLHDGAASPIPQKTGPYKIESLLNKGGMSLLYLASHPGTSQPIVIKILVPKYVQNKEMAHRFLKEAQIIAMTNHPNIVKLYGQGQWEKGLYIAMEFIRGISLRQFIQQKSLSQKRALEIILQVAYALCHLHTHGVIHRDLKPENILITESGEIKVIDFGIAQLQGEPEEERPHIRRMMGTPVYMSPEQKDNPLHVTYSSDIYSLGVIAYGLILGRLSHGVIHLGLLSKSLRTIIENALKADPKERYQDIVDFITDVSQYIKTQRDEREESKEETSDEILNMIQETRSALIPQKGPKWPPVEIGIAVHEGISLSGLYLDFFRLSENRFAIVLAEPLESTNSSLYKCATLKGMIRMAVELFFQNGKKDQHPIKMLHALNKTLSVDLNQKIGLCLLLLNPDKDQLSFISCDYTSLWHVPEGSKKVRVLATPNPPLGLDAGATLLETADNWNSGDTLILHSAGAFPAKPDGLEDILLLSPQHQSEKLLQKKQTESASLPTRASAVLSIQRIF